MTPFPINEPLLAARLTALEQARSWPPTVIARLASRIRHAPDEELFRINPLTYAEEQGLAEHMAIDLFLYAACHGLFEIQWHVLYVSCGTTREFSETVP